MEHRHLKFFVAVAEELHFTRAAARLRVAQPHLSHEIRRLESEIGTELFARNKRRVKLTPAGQVFLERVRTVFNVTEDAVRAAQRASSGEIGRLLVGFGSIASYWVMPNAVVQFRLAYPEVEITLTELHSDEGVEAVRTGRLDVCLVHPPRNVDPAMRVETVMVEPLVVALPKGRPLLKSAHLSLRRLRSEPWIFWHRENASRTYDEVVGACTAAEFQPNDVQRPMRLSTVICLVASGMGLALVPASAARLQIDGVAYRELKTPRIKVPLSLVTRPEHMPPALLPFMDVVRACTRAHNASTSRV